jgi:hypothetical protein
LDLAAEAFVIFFATFLAANDLAMAAFEALLAAFAELVLVFSDGAAPVDKSVGTPPANADVEKLNMLGMIIHLIGLSIIAGSLSFAHCKRCMFQIREQIQQH